MTYRKTNTVDKKPLITVLMPAYNIELYIDQAIESILNQTFKNFEFLIIDDASSDKTLSVIKFYMKKDKRIKLIINKKNSKIAWTLNKGIKEAKGEIIARMDPDDISYPDRLLTQLSFLKKHPKVAIVGSNIIIINSAGKVISKREYPTTSARMKSLMFRYSPFAHPAIMFRKNIFEEFGCYDVNMEQAEDLDLWFKIGSKYEFATIPKTLLQYRILPSSGFHNNLKSVEIFSFKIKLNAIFKYGYKVSVYDIFYNFTEFILLWLIPDKIRVWSYNFLRSKKLI
ncbi:MAG: glycosyltransferase [Candidatus Daviesbacteria bacterium]|nr:glycosyltransferase [Candidatus Daviesbacteria bacterium]